MGMMGRGAGARRVLKTRARKNLSSPTPTSKRHMKVVQHRLLQAGVVREQAAGGHIGQGRGGLLARGGAAEQAQQRRGAGAKRGGRHP